MSWLGPIRQISYTTDDLDGLLAFWETQAGVGPWSVFRNITLKMNYEGRSIALPCDVALAMHHDQLIELLQVNGNGPSPFHDALNRPIVGLQRLAALTDAIEADTKRAVERGLERFADGRDPTGQRYVYFRSASAPGVILELLETTPFFNDFLGRLAARARGYERSDAPAARIRAAPRPAVAGAASIRAALLTSYGEPEQFRIDDVPEPQPGPGELRIQAAAAAVNPFDVKLRRGYLKEWMPLVFPAQIGGDVAGTVDAIGDGVVEFRIGNRVMAMINPMANGAYAEKVVCPAAACALVPDSLDLVDAAALPTGALTGTQLIERGIRPRAGSKGLVIGAGGSTGRAAVFAALDAGAQVYAGVRVSSRDACGDLPVVGVIDLSDDKGLAAAGAFDFVADTVGGAVAEKLFAHMQRDGVLGSIAVPPPIAPSDSAQRFVSLIVSFDRARLERFARELASRNRRMPIAHRLPLTEIARAHRLMEQGGVGGKILLIF